MKIVYCEKHNLPSYVKDDGEVIHTCSVCHPELIEKPETRRSIVNYGSVYLNNDDVENVVKTGHIEYTVPDHSSDFFFNDAASHGVDLDYGDNVVNGLKVKVYRSNAKTREDKFYYSSNVYFDPKMTPPGDFKVHYNGNRAYVSNNNYAAYVLSTVLKGE